MLRILAIMLLFSFTIPYVTYAETELLKCSTFKLTIISSKGEEIEWEYENPDEFEVEVGNNVIKGDKAKQDVTTLFNELALTKDTNVDDIVQVMSNRGFKDIDSLVLKIKFHNEKIRTWKWTKD